jgi:hypothetical protein
MHQTTGSPTVANHLKPETVNKLISEALAIEAEEAKEAGALGFMARAMIQATLPHKAVKGNEFIRRNGLYTLTMLAPSKVGLPYGNVPRLLLAWLTTEAVKTKNRELYLGDSLTAFMGELGFQATGGRYGSITRLKTQTRRLFSTNIQCDYDAENMAAMVGYRLADAAMLWWDAKDPDQQGLWQSNVTLSQPFYDEITQHPVPVDLRALKALKRSPLALDIYCWLTYRLGYLKKRTALPWGLLQQQFGSDYPLTAQGKADFKRKFLMQLKKVQAVYPEANLDTGKDSLVLKPSPSHVKRIRG